MTLLLSASGYSQQTENLPVELKKTVDEFILKGEDFRKNGDINQAAFYYHQAGNVCWAQGYPQSAIELLSESLKLNEQLTNLNGVSILHTKLGLINSELKNYKASLDHFLKSLEMSRTLGHKQDVVSALINIANSYCDLEKYKESLPYLLEAEGIAKAQSDTKLLRSCYSLMTRVYDELGNRDKSTEYFNLFAAITKKVQEDETKRKEAEARSMVDKANAKVQEVVLVKEAAEQELKVKSEDLKKVEQISLEKQLKIDLLSKETELQMAEINQQKLIRKVYLIILAAVLMLTGVSVYGYYRIRRANTLLTVKNIEISQQKDEIEKQAQELRELNALKDKLFSIISHDLRSPLFSLISLLRMAKEGHFTDEEKKEILNELSRNVEYNSELLENLLKWASSQMKGNVINPVLFDINQVALTKINLYSKTASQKGIRLINGIPENSNVYADKDMIELVLRNLITNAIKFSEHGDEVLITSSSKNGMVEICVADTGVGISSRDVEKLFCKHIFSTRGTLNEKGTGLGLILSKDFIQMNGGSIWAESELGKGSKFFFTIPTSASKG